MCRPDLREPIYNRGFVHRNNDPTAKAETSPQAGIHIPVKAASKHMRGASKYALAVASVMSHIIQTCTVGFINLLKSGESVCYFETPKT